MIDKLPLFTDMVVFSSYAMQIVMSFLMLSMIFMIYPRASVSIKRINEVLETENTVKEGTKNIKETQIIITCTDDINIENVYINKFKVEDGKVLKFNT